MTKSLPLLCLIATFLMAQPAHSVAVLDLRTGDCHNQIICSLSMFGGGLDGTTGTFSSPRTSIGEDDFFAYSDGMIFGNGVFPKAFDLTFDRSVLWVGGTIAFDNGFQGFSVTGQGVGVGSMLSDINPGAFSLNAPLHFAANQTYRFDVAPSPAFSFGVFITFEFSSEAPSSAPSVVPLPATLQLLLSTMLFAAFLRNASRKAGSSKRRNGRTDHAVTRDNLGKLCFVPSFRPLRPRRKNQIAHVCS